MEDNSSEIELFDSESPEEFGLETYVSLHFEVLHAIAFKSKL